LGGDKYPPIKYPVIVRGYKLHKGVNPPRLQTKTVRKKFDIDFKKIVVNFELYMTYALLDYLLKSHGFFFHQKTLKIAFL